MGGGGKRKGWRDVGGGLGEGGGGRWVRGRSEVDREWIGVDGG